MATVLKASWSKPSAILFASEFPANERVFASALAQAAGAGAKLIMLHVRPSQSADPHLADHSHAILGHFDFLVERAQNRGVTCVMICRSGHPETEIFKFLHEKNIDRLVIGAHTPGPIGKVLIGSVAESLIRNADIPVDVIGPYTETPPRNAGTHTILCSVNNHPSSAMVACFAAELAARENANLVLQHVIPPQNAFEILGERSLDQLAAELHNLIPARLQSRLNVNSRVVYGDPTEELLYQGRVLRASLIVMGAQGASHFAAVSRAGVVYKVLAYSRCPVLTLSPVVLSGCGIGPRAAQVPEVNYLAGVV
ncbi:MAG TPA: universal stress protein [Terracidiphilus sp.]|nr:universal stress protein [Terracidiphilus sp.]